MSDHQLIQLVCHSQTIDNGSQIHVTIAYMDCDNPVGFHVSQINAHRFTRKQMHWNRITAERGLVGTDDPTFGILLTTWSGPTPIAPTYGMPYHQGIYRIAMAVDDINATFSALDQAGVARQRPYTFQLPGTKLTDGLTMMFIRDPDGILIELVDRPRQPQ